MRRRSLAAQSVRLAALGLLVAVLAFAAVGAPRAIDGVLDANLRTQVSTASASARDLVADVDATHTVGTYSDYSFTVSHTWNAMPRTLIEARAAMPTALRDATGRGRYTGVAAPAGSDGTAGIPGFGLGPAAGSPGGIEVISLEGYPDLRRDATLVSGRWPTAPVAGGPLPLVLTASTAKTLGWRLGETRTSDVGSLRLVGTIAPRATDSDYWQLNPIRAKTVSTLNSAQDPVYGSVGWVDSDDWAALAPSIAGTDVVAWYPVYGKDVSLASLGELQDGLTTFLANPRVIDDGTSDGHVLRLASGLPDILQAFEGTASTSSSVLLLAAVAALGVGSLVLLTTVSLVVRARRGVRELLRTRGATVARLARQTAGDVAVAAVPGAVVGSVVAVLCAAEPPGASVLGAREVVTAVLCALVPVVIAAAFVVFGEGLPRSVRSLVRRNAWVGQVLLVLVAAAALVVVAGEAAQATAQAQSGTPPSGSADPFVVVSPLLAGLAASVVVLRAYPWLLRLVARMLRGTGHPAAFVGVLEATRTAAVAWLATAALTATAAGALALELVTSASRAQAASNAPGAPLLAPGTRELAVAAVALCVVFAVAAFAVSSVAASEHRRRRARTLRGAGFTRAETVRVSAWGSVPVAIVSVVVGAVVGVGCAVPVLGAVDAVLAAASPIDSHSTTHATAAVMDWSLVALVAAAVLVGALVVEAVALATDIRTSRRHP